MGLHVSGAAVATLLALEFVYDARQVLVLGLGVAHPRYDLLDFGRVEQQAVLGESFPVELSRRIVHGGCRSVAAEQLRATQARTIQQQRTVDYIGVVVVVVVVVVHCEMIISFVFGLLLLWRDICGCRLLL